MTSSVAEGVKQGTQASSATTQEAVKQGTIDGNNASQEQIGRDAIARLYAPAQ